MVHVMNQMLIHTTRDITNTFSSMARGAHEEETSSSSSAEPIEQLDIGQWLQDIGNVPERGWSEPPDSDNIDIDNEDFEPELSLPGKRDYGRTVFSSTAYKWLLVSLTKAVMLSVEGDSFCAGLHTALSNYLEGSRARSISRRRASESYSMIFVAEWNPTIFLQEQFPNSTSDLGRLLGEVLTLTGSVTNAQMLPCAEYMRQTWPSTGSTLMKLLKTAVVFKKLVSGNYCATLLFTSLNLIKSSVEPLGRSTKQEIRIHCFPDEC